MCYLNDKDRTETKYVSETGIEDTANSFLTQSKKLDRPKEGVRLT